MGQTGVMRFIEELDRWLEPVELSALSNAVDAIDDFILGELADRYGVELSATEGQFSMLVGCSLVGLRDGGEASLVGVACRCRWWFFVDEAGQGGADGQVVGATEGVEAEASAAVDEDQAGRAA